MQIPYYSNELYGIFMSQFKERIAFIYVLFDITLKSN